MAAAGAALGLVALPAGAWGTMAYQPEGGAQGRIVVARDDGTGGRTLPARGMGPVISPDGTMIAALAPPGSYQSRLRIIRIAGGQVRTSAQVCRGGVLTWSPDSTRVLCQTETADARGFVTGNGLAVVDAATGRGRTLVAAPGAGVESFAWAPGGRRIAYAGGRFGATTTDVYVIDAEGPVRPRLIIRRATSPLWGPRTIAVARFATRRERVGGRPLPVTRTQIWTVNPGGGGAHRLTGFGTTSPLVTGPFPVFWTRSGSAIVGVIGGTDTSDLIRVDARTGTIRRLGPVEASADGLSADGRTVLYTTGFTGPSLRTGTVSMTGRAGRTLLRGVTYVSVSRDWTP